MKKEIKITSRLSPLEEMLSEWGLRSLREENLQNIDEEFAEEVYEELVLAVGEDYLADKAISHPERWPKAEFLTRYKQLETIYREVEAESKRQEKSKDKYNKWSNRFGYVALGLVGLMGLVWGIQYALTKPQTPVILCHHFESNRYSHQEIADKITKFDPHFNISGLAVKENEVVYCHEANAEWYHK